LVRARRSSADAARGVQDAERSATEARQNLNQAIKDGRRELEDLTNAQRDAELAARGAVQSQKEASRLCATRFARGALKISTVCSSKSITRRSARLKLGRTSSALKKIAPSVGNNVKNLDSVRQAERQVESANRSIDDARRRSQDASVAIGDAARSLERAGRAQTQAADAGQNAATTLAFLRSQLTPAENALTDSLLRFRQTYRREFRPITDIIINAVRRGVDDGTKILQNDRG
jgi:hypothetical protein